MALRMCREGLFCAITIRGTGMATYSDPDIIWEYKLADDKSTCKKRSPEDQEANRVSCSEEQSAEGGRVSHRANGNAEETELSAA